MLKKSNLRDRVVDGELDLSMSDLQEVPVKDIVLAKKATSLDLSNNRLSGLGKTFASLSHLIRLDLSKNQISKLPDNFGDLVLLKHLDLYSNQLAHLPLSFGQLRNLKWLDLKNNPLVPALAEVAGPCQDSQQCQECARRVVKVIGEAKQRCDEEQRKLAQLEREKEMAEKAAAKKEQQKNKKAIKNEKKKNQENGLRDHATHENNMGPQKKKEKAARAAVKAPVRKQSRSLMRSLLKLIFVVLFTLAAVLGFLFVVDQEKYLVVRTGAERVLNSTMEMVPPGVVLQARKVTDYVRPTLDLAIAQGKWAFNETTHFLNNDPRVKQTWVNVKATSSAASEWVVDGIRTLYHKVPILVHDMKKKWME